MPQACYRHLNCLQKHLLIRRCHYRPHHEASCCSSTHLITQFVNALCLMHHFSLSLLTFFGSRQALLACSLHRQHLLHFLHIAPVLIHITTPSDHLHLSTLVCFAASSHRSPNHSMSNFLCTQIFNCLVSLHSSSLPNSRYEPLQLCFLSRRICRKPRASRSHTFLFALPMSSQSIKFVVANCPC